MWCACSCATAYLLTGAQHTLRAGIVRGDRELFHQIIVNCASGYYELCHQLEWNTLDDQFNVLYLNHLMICVMLQLQVQNVSVLMSGRGRKSENFSNFLTTCSYFSMRCHSAGSEGDFLFKIHLGLCVLFVNKMYFKLLMFRIMIVNQVWLGYMSFI